MRSYANMYTLLYRERVLKFNMSKFNVMKYLLLCCHYSSFPRNKEIVQYSWLFDRFIQIILCIFVVKFETTKYCLNV